MSRISKSIISVLLAFIMLPHFYAKADNIKFSDVTETHWAYSTIMDMAQKGYFKGTSNPVNGVGTFSPSSTMSRAEFLTVAMRVMFPKEATEIKQAINNWWTGYYNLAIEKGILISTELDFGKLERPMTRQEMAMVLVRCVEKNESLTQRVDVSQISDYKSVENYYKQFVWDCFSFGLLCGVDDKGTFMPNETLDRAQGATVLCRLIDKDKRISIEDNKAKVQNNNPQNNPNSVVSEKSSYISTPYITLAVPEQLYSNTVQEVTDDDPYTILFISKKDREKLFELVFNGTGDNLLGTVIRDKENIVIYTNIYSLDSRSKYYKDNLLYQEHINDIIESLASYYKFIPDDVVMNTDDEVFEIKTDVLSLYYPKKWQEIVEIDTLPNGVRFSNDGVHLFDILFESDLGYCLGFYNGTQISIVYYTANTNEQIEMMEDMNVVFHYLMQDGNFSQKKLNSSDNEEELADIDTKYVTFKVTKAFKNEVSYEIISESPYTVLFRSKKDNTDLFSLVINGEGDLLLGTVIDTNENAIIYANIYKLDKNSKNYNENLSFQESINVIIENLANDYQFVSNQAIENENIETFDIQTSLLTLKYPIKWKNKVYAEVTDDGVRFYNNNVPLFEIMFTDNGGYILGNYKGNSLYFTSYSVSSAEQIEMQEDANVTLQYIMNDKDFVANK